MFNYTINLAEDINSAGVKVVYCTQQILLEASI